MSDMNDTRRTFLKLAAGVGTIKLVGVAGAQEDADIVLEGRREGWGGVEPEEIEDEDNPTLELEQGAEYVLEWSNEDGQPHNFAIEDNDGENLVETDIITSGSQEVEFVAEEEMSEYYCEPHPQSMRGEIELVEDVEREEREADDVEDDDEEDDVDDEDVDEEIDEEEDPSIGEDVDPEEDEPSEVFELERTEDGWVGVEPEEIEGETNPTLEVENEEVYEIVVTSELEDEDHMPGPVLLIVNEDGEDVVHTDFLDEDLEVDTVLFRADPSIIGYLDQMELDVGGDIEVENGDDEADDDDENGDDETNDENADD